MVSLENFLASQRDYNQNMAQQNARSQAGMINPLGVLAGAATGFLTGGPVGAALGGLGGLRTTQDTGAPGVAQSGLQGLELGSTLNPIAQTQPIAVKDFLKYFKPFQPKAGEIVPQGITPAPDFMKKIFPGTKYYIYQEPKVVDFSYLLGGGQ